MPQCGYCINGWIMTAAAFLANKKKPTDAEIKAALEGAQVPLRHACQHPASAVKRAADDDGLRESTMTKMEKPTTLSRRAVLKGAGALVVSVGAPVGARHRCSASTQALRAGRQAAADAGPALLLHRDQRRRHGRRPSSARWTWARACSSPSARWSPKSSTCRSRPSRSSWATPRTSVNQGGASGSTGIQLGGKQMRMAAAEARRVLVEMAAAEARHAGRPAHRHRRRRQRRVQPRQEDRPTPS